MQNKKAITHIIQLSGSVRQAFDPKYLNEAGQVQNSYMNFAIKAHGDLNWFLNNKFKEMEDTDIKDALRPWKKENITILKNALRRLEDGTFTFRCEEACDCHPNRGGNCTADLTEEKLRAMPGARNCATFRGQKGLDLPRVLVCKPMTKVG